VTLPTVGKTDLEWYMTATRSDAEDPNCPLVMRSMAAELLALRDFVDRYRKTWAGAHSDYQRHRDGVPGCLVCEADKLLGDKTT
jgi:hypothetical protein